MLDLSLNSLERASAGLRGELEKAVGVRLMAGFRGFSNRLDSVASAADSDNLSVMK
jgi:hypothetical protein